MKGIFIDLKTAKKIAQYERLRKKLKEKKKKNEQKK